MNIFSGEQGLGGALTNPTELARKKGCIQHSYPVVYGGKRYADVEVAYMVLNTGVDAADDKLMAELIAAKFQQHPALLAEVQAKGGASFLEKCSHFTNARSSGFQSWEGHGLDSRFIRNLIAGYTLATSDQVINAGGQLGLF